MHQSPSHTQARQLWLALLFTLSLVLTGCSSDSDDDPAPDMNPDNQAMDMDPVDQEQTVPGVVTRTSIGDVLVYGSDRLTLYTFASDTTGVSNCSDGCAINWPPVLADVALSEGDFTTITRPDDTLQWAYRGWPLYYYSGDSVEGDINGEGLGDVWYVARPDPVAEGSISAGPVLVGQGTVQDSGNDPASRTDFDGYTLYVFTSDAPNVSVCNGQCAVVWPPLYADPGAVASGDYSIVTRDDGTRMWAYRQQPLYFYQDDTAPGDFNGEGVNGVWFIATP